MNLNQFSNAGKISDPSIPAISTSISFARAHHCSSHQHARAQFVYAYKGAIQIKANGVETYLPSMQAIWIPAGTTHSLRATELVSYVSVFIDPVYCQSFLKTCKVIQSNLLIHELILNSVEFNSNYKVASPEFRLSQVLIDQIKGLQEKQLGLVLPHSIQLVRVINDFISRPLITHSLTDYANRYGASLRTLQRRFKLETGMSFTRWQQYFLAYRAIEQLALGHSLAKISYELGYCNLSAFSQMFKRVIGVTAKQMMAQRQ